MNPQIAQIGLTPLTWMAQLDGSIPFDQSVAAQLNQVNIDGYAKVIKVLLPEGFAVAVTEGIQKALLALQVPKDTACTLPFTRRHALAPSWSWPE